MTDQVDELAGKTEEEMKAIASQFNAMNPDATGTDAEQAARAAEAELAKSQGNTDTAGRPAVVADTEEQIAAKKVKDAEAAAKAVEDGKTDEEKAAEKVAAEAADVEAKRVAADALANADWIELEGAEGKAAMNILKSTDMTPAEAQELFGDALNSMDISLVDRDALVKAIGEDKATLAMSAITAWAGKEGASILDRVNQINDIVGGNENWLKMQVWARAKAETDPAFKADIEELTGMLNGSKTAGKLAATQFKEMYNADAKNTAVTATPAKEIKATAAAPRQEVLETITKRQYAEACEDLSKSGLRGAALEAQMAKLSARRRYSRANGMD